MTYARKTVEDVAHIIDEDLNEESIDYIQYKFESLINVMHLASDIHGVPQSFIDKLEEFVHCLDDFAKDFKNSNSSFIPGLLFTGSRGRPAFQISKDILQMFIDNKFTINSMAKMLQVSESTIKRRLHLYELSISSTYSNLSNEALDVIVRDILDLFPKTGYKRMIGFLMARGHRVQEKRVREVMRRVDPEGVIERSISLHIIHRRRYSVPSTLALWHIDGHHKIVRYWLVFY